MPKILIVDDEPLDRELAERCLGGLKAAELRFACDGLEALAVIEQEPPDVVLTDLRMPRLNGLDLVTRVKDENPLIPLIIMTSHGGEAVAVKALRAGASSYVPKRDLGRSLVETIEQVLEVAEARKTRHEALRFLAHTESKFVLNNDLSLLAPVASFLQESLESLGFGTEAGRTQVGMAVVEALSNAIIHGNLGISSELKKQDRSAFQREIERRSGMEPFAARRVCCVARATQSLARYVITDEGDGFRPNELPDPTAPENLMQVSGRGLFLIRTFMDRVSFNESGNEITLEKRA